MGFFYAQGLLAIRAHCVPSNTHSDVSLARGYEHLFAGCQLGGRDDGASCVVGKMDWIRAAAGRANGQAIGLGSDSCGGSDCAFARDGYGAFVRETGFRNHRRCYVSDSPAGACGPGWRVAEMDAGIRSCSCRGLAPSDCGLISLCGVSCSQHYLLLGRGGYLLVKVSKLAVLA